MKRIQDQSSELLEQVTAERQAREETEESMLELLRDMVGRIKSEIDSERKEREQSEEALLQLLEETCSKLSVVTKPKTF